MSSISTVDSKESNSVELLNIPDVHEVSEIIDVNNFREVQQFKTNDEDNAVFENIKLDKTNIKTYMNDFNKNFHNIKFSQGILEDICELHCKNKETSNTKDFRNFAYEEYKAKNTITDDKLIQPVPIGMRGLYSSNEVNVSTSLVKSTITTREKGLPEPPEIPCVGFSYGLNPALTYPVFRASETIQALNKTVPMKLNLSIPGFTITTGDLTNLGFLDRMPIFDDTCGGAAKTKDLIIPGYLCSYEGRCNSYVAGWFDCKKYGVKDQIVYGKKKYAKKTLVNFNGVGVKFEGSFSTKFQITFEMETNMPISVILNIIQAVDVAKFNSIDKTKTINVQGLLNELIKIFTFQNIVQIMIFVFVYIRGTDFADPYVDFSVTSIKTIIDFKVTTFSVNYGSNTHNIGGFNYNKEFEGLADGKYISLSINPLTVEIEAKFVFFSGTLSELFFKIADSRVAPYIQNLLTKIPIKSGIFVILLIIIYETILKNQFDITSLNLILNKTPQQIAQLKSLTTKQTELNNQINGIINFINILSKIDVGGTLTMITSIMEKIEPTIELSVGVCTGLGIPPVMVACGSMSFPEVDILRYIKTALTATGNTIPKLEIADKISEKYIDLMPGLVKQFVRGFNNSVDAVENSLRNGFVISVGKVFDLLDDAQLGFVVSPSVDLCVAL